MHLHLQRQIDKLKRMILQVGTLTEEAVHGAIRSVQTRDDQLAEHIIQSDEQIDLMEVDLEEECLHTLALHQPVAFDLRYVIAILKINNDLERIADLASGIAQQAVVLSHQVKIDIPPTLFEMAQTAQSMLRQCLDALIRIDTRVAQSIRETDDLVDGIHRQIHRYVEERIREHPDQVQQALCLLSVARNLERIADHAVNIAEDILYLEKGEIIRHTHLQHAPTSATTGGPAGFVFRDVQ